MGQLDRIHAALTLSTLLLLPCAPFAVAQPPHNSPTLILPRQGALDIALHDAIDSPIYTWPTTLLGYAVDFTAHPCTESHLHLTDDRAQEIPFQLSSVTSKSDGTLTSAK